MPTRAYATLRDAKNQTASVHFFCGGAGPTGDVGAEAGAVAAAIGAASNAHLESWTGSAVAASVAGSGTGRFIDAEDKCVVVLQTTSGAVHRFSIPAPKDTCFLADGETMDGAGPGQAVGAALLTYGASQDGVAFDSVIGGYRTRSKTQRRFGVRTRNPVLTGQGL
jgi:hypothetical protein